MDSRERLIFILLDNEHKNHEEQAEAILKEFICKSELINLFDVIYARLNSLKDQIKSPEQEWEFDRVLRAITKLEDLIKLKDELEG